MEIWPPEIISNHLELKGLHLTEIRVNLLNIISLNNYLSYFNKTFRNWKQNIWKQLIPSLKYHSTKLKFLMLKVGRYIFFPVGRR